MFNAPRYLHLRSIEVLLGLPFLSRFWEALLLRTYASWNKNPSNKGTTPRQYYKAFP